MDLQQELQKLQEQAIKKIQAIKNSEDIEKIRVLFLGRKGKIKGVMKKLKDMKPEERKGIGTVLNAARDEISKHIEYKKKMLQMEKDGKQRDIDITTPVLNKRQKGKLHPVVQAEQQIWDIFRRLNFDIVETPEIESDFYNFQSLNIPPDHPARDMQDTFYVEKHDQDGRNFVLRTQTSTVQARYAKDHEPPIRVINTGKCYRKDADLTHTPMFHQFDGFWIDEKVTMADLKGLLEYAMSEFFEQEIKVRFRISYFPFVEPGAEFDVTCTICGGDGCATCKKTGWIEMGGCGVIHPKVLDNIGIDKNKYQGIAWGFGMERPFMIKHKINDLRLFFENGIRFLDQF